MITLGPDTTYDDFLETVRTLLLPLGIRWDKYHMTVSASTKSKQHRWGRSRVLRDDREGWDRMVEVLGRRIAKELTVVCRYK